ncbi:MAG: protein kinase [Proteobacteria bacterium]|nr:protein kinase [Pseudomonadota bacterium]
MMPPQIRDLYGEPLAPGALAGLYIVQKLAHRGRNASIYRATHSRSGQPAALKVLHLDLADSLAAMAGFHREAELLRNLHHPHIARMLELSELHDGRPYLAMEWFESSTLSDELDRRGPLPIAEVLALMDQLCSAVSFLHQQGIIHRGLDADNILAVPGPPILIEHGRTPGRASGITVKLIDFGAATQLSPAPGSRSRPPIKADGIVAPEQLHDQRLDRRADIYALGSLLHHLVTGQAPPGADRGDPGQRANAARSGSVGLASVIARAMAEAPAQRYPTVEALQDALRSVVKRDSQVGQDQLSTVDDGREASPVSCGPEASERSHLSDRASEPAALESPHPGFAMPSACRDGAGSESHRAGHESSRLVPPGHATPAGQVRSGRAADRPALPHPGDRINQYELIRVLGRGGMSIVYLARDTVLACLVAVKFQLEDEPDLRQRFVIEGRALKRCQHENIVVVHHADNYRGRPFMVLEYLKGRTLADLARGDTLTVQRAVELMVPVLRALQCAHEHGIVHRDLKPSNIVLTDSGVVKVIDFGVAKQLAPPAAFWAAVESRRAAEPIDRTSRPALPGRAPAERSNRPALRSAGASIVPRSFAGTASRTLLGTLAYMSPEQLTAGNWGIFGPTTSHSHDAGPDAEASDEAVDHRTDLWAVGITLHELVTGRHPLEPLTNRTLAAITDLDRPMPDVSEHAPELGPLAPIVQRCLIKRKADRTGSASELLGELEGLLPGGSDRLAGDRDGDDTENPFAGLAAFTESAAHRFFGRSREITSTVERLRQTPMLFLTGPSGTGKSSLVRAGVIPAIKRSGEGWQAEVIRPGRRPLRALADLLASLSPNSSAGTSHDWVHRLDREPGSLGVALRQRARRTLRRILLFVDQFEELYTADVSADQCESFIDCLAGVADDPTSPLRIILAIRSDFLHRIVDNDQLAPRIAQGLVLLPSMSRDNLGQALTRPLKAAGHSFDSDRVVDDMLDTVEARPGALPLLQFTAAQLWDMRDRQTRLLTASSYDEIGGITGTLARHADAVLAALPASKLALARALFERLVTPARTRAMVKMAELRDWSGQPEQGDHGHDDLDRDPREVEKLVHYLADARLLAMEVDARGGGSTVELVHESLIDGWPTLQSWLDENHDDKQMLARLHTGAEQWQASDRSPGTLWHGEPVREALYWRQRYRGRLTEAQEQFLDAAQANMLRSQRMRWRAVIAAITAVVCVAVLLAVLSWRENRAAQQAQKQAMRARNASRMAAARQWQHDPTTALALLREIEQSPPPGWSVAARWALYSPLARAVHWHPEPVFAAVFSADGTRIASAGADSAVRVWSADGSGETLILRGHDDTVRAVVFSRDGRRIVSGSMDGTVRVWPADGRGEPLVLRGHDGPVVAVQISPDGQRIVSGSVDRTVRVWPADGSGQPVVLRGHDGPVWSVDVSPDSRRIVSSSQDASARLWPIDGGAEPEVLRHDSTAGVLSVAFSPDGQRIVSASEDTRVRVWPLHGNRRPQVLKGHEKTVWSAAFSPDGRHIVSAADDKTVRVWSLDRPGEPLVLAGHQEAVWSAAFDPDGQSIVSTSLDGSVRVWPAHPPREPVQLRAATEAVLSVAFSPDSTLVASASVDTRVRVWPVDGSADPLVLTGHQGKVLSVAFAPDGTRLVSSSEDKTVRVWTLASTGTEVKGQPVVLSGHQDEVNSVAFSPDGRFVVSGSLDKTVRLWPADGTGQPLLLRGHQDGIEAVAFAPDGQHIVSASRDKTVRVWRADGVGQAVVLRGHTRWVYAVAFSPDSSRLVSASFDRTVRVWPADGRGDARVLRGHERAVFAARFMPDGKRVISGSGDRTVRIWSIGARPTDDRGASMIVPGHPEQVWDVAASPDGRRIATAGLDGVVRVWSDLAPLAPNSINLWQATAYCLPVEQRMRLVGVDRATARRNRQQCLDRVANAARR